MLTRRNWRKAWRRSVEKVYEDTWMNKLNQGNAHLPCEKVGYEYPGYLDSDDTSFEDVPASSCWGMDEILDKKA